MTIIFGAYAVSSFLVSKPAILNRNEGDLQMGRAEGAASRIVIAKVSPYPNVTKSVTLRMATPAEERKQIPHRLSGSE
jgi:hypothetical protein